MKSSTKLYKYTLDYSSLGLTKQAHTLTTIVIIVTFSQAIIDIEKIQYRSSLLHRAYSNLYHMGENLLC